MHGALPSSAALVYIALEECSSSFSHGLLFALLPPTTDNLILCSITILSAPKLAGKFCVTTAHALLSKEHATHLPKGGLWCYKSLPKGGLWCYSCCVCGRWDNRLVLGDFWRGGPPKTCNITFAWWLENVPLS